MSAEDVKVTCSTFQKQEPVIQDLTDRINNAAGVREKAELAGELQEEVDALCSCPDRDQEDPDCSICRVIAGVRMKTAGLIIDAAKLA